jgi:predicted acylesterase/phospholipase RssA
MGVTTTDDAAPTGLAALLARGRVLWIKVRTFLAVLKIVRFSLLIPGVLLVAVIVSAQMRDILRSIGENAHAGQIAALLVTSAFTALVVWYTARTMLRFEFEANPASNAAVMPRLKRHLPRLLALAVPLTLAIRVLFLAKDSASRFGVYVLAASLAAIALLVWAYVAKRRDLARTIPRLRGLAEPESTEQRNLFSFEQLSPSTRGVFYALLATNVVLMVVFIFKPVAIIGAPAILLLALGLITVVGSAGVYMANHYEVPILTLVIVWVVACSFFNDNHAVRVNAPGTPTPSPLADRTLDRYFSEWFIDLASKSPSGGPVPVVLVAAEGGGIRAAYWSAAVLADLEDRTAGGAVPLSRRVFAISGVSGGALGAATFASIVARREVYPDSDGERSRLREVDQVLGRDFLSPTLATMLFPDLLQRFLPVPVFRDRAVAIEESWERAWDLAHPDDVGRFRRPFHDLWRETKYAVPLLFLNSTVVETGQRAVVHPLGSYPAGQTGPFADALDVSALMGTELPVSTAAHLSARFTYVSPAGLVDTHRTNAPRWIRLVDGGYFDNSGTATLQEIARVIQRAHGEIPGARPMRLIVLHIPNDPPNDRPDTAGGSGRVALPETLSPIRALLATRGAHATQAIEFMRGTTGSEQITLTLNRAQAALPLGWVLSDLVRTQIRAQTTECVAVVPEAPCAADLMRSLLQEIGSSAE